MRKTLVLAGCLFTLSACSTQEVPEVSFSKDVMPIITAECLDCHNAPEAKGTKVSGLMLDSYAALMKGTKFGPIVDPGYPMNSVLNQVIEGRVDKSIAMPHGKGKAIAEKYQKVFRDWVAQGAKDN